MVVIHYVVIYCIVSLDSFEKKKGDRICYSDSYHNVKYSKIIFKFNVCFNVSNLHHH